MSDLLPITSILSVELPSMFFDRNSIRRNPGHDAGTKICPSGVIISGQDSVTTHI